MKKYILAFLAFGFLFAVSSNAGKAMTENAKDLMKKAQTEVNGLTPKEVHTIIEADEDFIELDVRENNQYGHGEIWTMEMVKLTRGYIEYKVEHAIEDKKTKRKGKMIPPLCGV